MEITKDVALKVLQTVDAGLTDGKGKPIPGQMCVEAAVCYAMGLPHGDNPSCVAQSVRQFKIGLNDSGWSSKQARAKGMRRLALVQLGTAGAIDEVAFAVGVSKLASQWAADANAARYAVAAARYAADAAARYAADAADADAADDAAARYAARYGAYAAANAARYAAAADASYGAEYPADTFLSAAAEQVVQLLVELGAPGAQWLALTEI